MTVLAKDRAEYNRWAAWVAAGRPKGKRPKGVRSRIPTGWWEQYRLEHQKPTERPYGTKTTAGMFAGRGIMLGSNPDVWNQAHQLVDGGHLEVVACIPSMPVAERARFGSRAGVVVWCPPEATAERPDIVQAESQPQWNTMDQTAPGFCVNAWTYGRFTNRVAMPEAYYNEGWAVDFGVYKNYMSQGAKAVIPVCGGYSTPARSDQESARLYAALGTLPFPGFWMYAGESMLTSESVEVLKQWKPS